MSDTSSRNSIIGPQLLADALLRSVAGATALLRVTGVNTDSVQLEVGLIATTFYDVAVSPVVMRKLRPSWKENDQPKWELLVSSTSVEAQVHALELSSAQALFDLATLVTVSGKDYLIESVASNEAFGMVYLYRLLVREAYVQSL